MLPIEETELGMSMLVSPLQSENAKLPIEETELGMVMLVRPLQFENAELPIEVTELGMVIFDSSAKPYAKYAGIR